MHYTVSQKTCVLGINLADVTDFKNSFTVAFYLSTINLEQDHCSISYCMLSISLHYFTAPSVDTIAFQQVADGVRGRVLVQENKLIFVAPGVKISGA